MISGWEASKVADLGQDGRRSELPDSRNGLKPLAPAVVLEEDTDLVVGDLDLVGDVRDETKVTLESVLNEWGQLESC